MCFEKIVRARPAPAPHWVGDGLRVQALLTHESHGQMLSPFLMLDDRAHCLYKPTTQARGVGSHPYRPWRYAVVDCGQRHRASGVPLRAFTHTGGTMHMAQLWVNLPARAQMMTPGYQGLVNKDIPCVEQLNGAVKVRIIAGPFEGQEGPARKQTPMRALDVQILADA